MDALTPARPALRLLARNMNTASVPDRSPCFTSLTFRSLRLQPPPRPPAPLYHATPQLTGSPALRRSRLHHSSAGSPILTGRIEFVILRMDRSPPAAPHPASLRRSCIRLQAGERMPGEDFHPSVQRYIMCARRRTGGGAPARPAT